MGKVDSSFGFVQASQLTRDNMICGPVKELEVGDRFYPGSKGAIIVKRTTDLSKVNTIFDWYEKQKRGLNSKFLSGEFGSILKFRNTGLEVNDDEELSLMMEMLIDEI